MEHHNIITHNQSSLCRSNHEEIRSISKGARHAILDCQRRFNASKWNCTTFDSPPIFGAFISKISVSDIFKLGHDCFVIVLEWCTRETALLYSYFMAGATWALATDCRSMKLIHCACERSGDTERSDNGDVVFYDCNANVQYARRFMDEFVLNMMKESNIFCHRLSWNNSICGFNVSLP